MTEPNPLPPGRLTPEQHDQTVSLLVLRHLYDGEVIDYPLPPNHPHAAVFERLVREGLINRWDRTWPLHDRYRLTDRGIARIETVYHPDEAEKLFQDMQQRNLRPSERRRELQQRGYDPLYWSTVHDPYTHWSTWDDDPGPYYRTVLADDPPPTLPPRPTHRTRPDPNDPSSVHDLDRESGRVTQFERDAGVPAYDVS